GGGLLCDLCRLLGRLAGHCVHSRTAVTADGWLGRAGPVSATLCLAALLVAAGRQARDHGGKLLEHLRPAELGAPKRLIAPRLGEVEARGLEEGTRPPAVPPQPGAPPGTLAAGGRPPEATRTRR